MHARILAAAALAALLAGCTAMLPRGSTDAPSPFATFKDAQQAAEKIVPFKTPSSELAKLGFDAEDGRNVTVIPYPDIVARLAPYSGVPLDQLDPGIRTCILAKTACRGYVFRFQKEDRTREGGFWADFLNVTRETHVRGWWFEALVVVNDGTVLFRNVSGQPRVERLVRERNPLGPFQPAGEGAGAVILR